jgi:hypothetical protein
LSTQGGGEGDVIDLTHDDEEQATPATSRKGVQKLRRGGTPAAQPQQGMAAKQSQQSIGRYFQARHCKRQKQ